MFVSDPAASYPNVDFNTPPEDYIPGICDGSIKRFRVGTYIDEELSMFVNAAFGTGDCCLVIEECGLVFKRGADVPAFFKPMLFMGRHQRADLLLVAQRAASIPIAMRSQVNRIVSFRQDDPDDVDALCERIGREYADTLPELEKLECLDWDRDSRRIRRYMVKP